METRRLGRTGHHSSLAILGGAAFWDASTEVAAPVFQAALDRGVNHLDIAPQYGLAEDAIGPLVPAVRDRLFVAAKTLRANPDGVRDQLETTMTKLGVDQLDLYQLHAVTDLDELERRASAAEAILRARDEGLVRYVGITGHDLGTCAAQLEALRRWDLDTVMFPVSPRLWAEAQFRSDAEALLAHCTEHDVGVQAIKAASWRPWGQRRPTHMSWYEPLQERGAIQRSVNFALSTPGVQVFATPGDREVLMLALDAADAYEPLDDEQRAAAIAATDPDDLIFPIAEKAVAR